MSRRIAIVLHGPPGTGKSTIARELCRRFENARLISLDEGWCPGEIRYQGGPSRYADMSGAAEPVVIVEIGCGEPPDIRFNGATRAADEWVEALRNSGRELFPFLLCAEFGEIVRRLTERVGNGPDALFHLWTYLGLHALHEHRDPLATFCPIPEFEEKLVETSGRTLQEVVQEIIDTVSPSSPVGGLIMSTTSPTPPGPTIPLPNPDAPSEVGFFEVYASFARTLRTWLVAYGIGAPALFASQPAFARVLSRLDLAQPIIYLFLAGVAFQVLLSLLYKYSMWYLYLGEVDPGFRNNRRYRFSDWFSSQTWFELGLDLVSICSFAWATVRLLFAFVETAPKP